MMLTKLARTASLLWFAPVSKVTQISQEYQEPLSWWPMVILKDLRYYFADKKEIDASMAVEKPRSSLRPT